MGDNQEVANQPTQEVLDQEDLPITEESLDKIGLLVERIESSKQKTALAQIEATSKDNERQFKFAVQKEENELSKWNKSFIVGTVSAGILALFSIYLIVSGEKDIGLGLLASDLSAVFGFIAGSGTCKK